MPNIYLVGFMGTGKTSVGQVLATKLKRVFVDMDELIEQKERMPIPEIFEKKGEAYFRGLERELVVELSQRSDLVVACGGGVFVDADNIRLMKTTGMVVCLVSEPETILARVKRFSHRPLLRVADPLSRIKELLKQRQPFYAQAQVMIDCDRLTVGETADKIAERLELP